MTKKKPVVKTRKKSVKATTEKTTEKKTNTNSKAKAMSIGFGRTSQGAKIVHVLILTKEDKGVIACQFGRNEKEQTMNSHLDITHVNCNNCFKTEIYIKAKAEHEAIQKENAVLTQKAMKDAGKRRKADLEKKKEDDKQITTIPEDSVLMYYAAQRNGESLVTVIAENAEVESIKIAKQKIEDELKGNKSKFKRWEAGGKIIRSKYIPVNEIENYLGSESHTVRDTMKGTKEQLFTLLSAILKELRDINRNMSFTAKNTWNLAPRKVISRKPQGRDFNQHREKTNRKVIPRG